MWKRFKKRQYELQVQQSYLALVEKELLYDCLSGLCSALDSQGNYSHLSGTVSMAVDEAKKVLVGIKRKE